MSAPEVCPICDGPLQPTRVRAYDRLVTGEGPFAVVECAACQYGITVPQLSVEELGPYYADSYYEDFYEHTGGRGGSPLHRLRELLRRRGAEGRWRRPPFQLDGIEPGAVLEVGCGAGELLAQFAARGWETYGIDPGAAAAAAAARRGAEVHTGTLDDQPWPAASFQLVVFQHSLEHIPDPVAAVRAATELLAPGGLLLVDVPNWASWQRRLFGNRWFVLDLPRHLQHFSPRALTRLAPRLGLEPRAVGTNSNAISTAYSVHYLIAGRWTPGWKLWLAYGLSLPLLPFVWLGDRVGGGDACYAVIAKAE
jgi:SAM-dependent methyltransferase